MRVTLPKLMNISLRAQSLAEYLNLDFKKLPKFTRDEVQVIWYARVALENPKLAERLQKDIRRILVPLTRPRERPSLKVARRLIAGLIKKANRARFKVAWTYRITRGQASDPISRICRLWIPVTVSGKETQKVGWHVSSAVSSPKPDEEIYYEVVRLLESGELSQLRSCAECQKFFVVVDPRREFCSDRCRTAFNNRQRLESGWFTEQRHQKRESVLKKARSLRKEGKPLEEVSKETGLSIRVLKRAGLTDDN